MIGAALVVGCGCMALIVRDLWRHPANALSVMRTTLAALWGAGWLVYGINLARFPAPDLETLLYLIGTCAISIAMIPSPERLPVIHDSLSFFTPAGRGYFRFMLGISAAVVLWDAWHVIELSSSVGFQQAIVAHRVGRTLKAGGYALPGMEVAHSIAAATGALGYALWLAQRRTEGAVAAAIGLASMLTSTGRWDVVAYGLWCLVLEAVFARDMSPRRFIASNVRVFALLAIFFVAHGELLAKVGSLQTLAEMPAGMRAAALNTPDSLGYDGAAPMVATRSGGAWEATRTCGRWADGQEVANKAFLGLSRVLRVFVLYFAGPFAAFDRVVCEGRPAVREVIFYWPLKIARLLHLTMPTPSYAVDPFIDIGIGYNNYTLFYPFLGKFGGVGGMFAWLMTAIALRFFIGKMFSGAMGVPGLVAGVAPFAIAVRGLWTNAFFDGSMVVYVMVACGAYAVSRSGRMVHQAESPMSAA